MTDTPVKVTLWFDPICPFGWITSRWILDVAKIRNVDLDFKVMSLAVLNKGREVDDYHKDIFEKSWLSSLAATAAKEKFGDEGLRNFYESLGTKLHLESKQLNPELVFESLKALDISGDELSELIAEIQANIDPAKQADPSDSSSLTGLAGQLYKSHFEAMNLVGSDVGCPVISINGVGLFGPVLSPAPKGEAAGELFDGFVKVCAFEGFYELKRSRTGGPVFN